LLMIVSIYDLTTAILSIGAILLVFGVDVWTFQRSLRSTPGRGGARDNRRDTQRRDFAPVQNQAQNRARNSASGSSANSSQANYQFAADFEGDLAHLLEIELANAGIRFA